MAKAILLFSIPDIKSIGLENNDLHDRGIVWIPMDYSVKLFFENKGIRYASMSDYMTFKVNHLSVDWQKGWSSKKFKTLGNKDIKGLFMHKGVSLWWFGDFWLYYHPVHRNTAYEIIIWAEFFLNLAKNRKIDEIILPNADETITAIARMVCRKYYKKLTLVKCRKTGLIKKIYDFNKPNIVEFMKDCKFQARKIMSNLLLNPKNNENREEKYAAKDKMLFITYSSCYGKIIDEDNTETESDKYYHPLIKRLKRYSAKLVDIDYNPDIGILNMLRRKNYTPFEYYAKGTSGIVRRKKQEFKKIWKMLKHNDEFIESFEYKGMDLWPILRYKMKFLITRRFTEAVKYIETAINMVRHENPKKMFLLDETSAYPRACLAAARMKGIPSFAMQHGMIGDTSYEYRHKDISRDFSLHNSRCPIPNLTFVYGDFTKDLLVKNSAYPKNSVISSGQPRYDILEDPEKVFDRDKVYDKLGLDKEKKLVVFASEALVDIEAGDLPLAAFKAIGRLMEKEGINFVVKLHPRETKEIWKFYENLAKKFRVNAVITKDINTFELLYACDVLVNMHSTVALEAMILNKPVVVINVTGKEDFMPYVKSRAAMKAYSPAEIEPAVRKALHIADHKKEYKKLLKNMKAFVKHHLHSIRSDVPEKIIKIAENYGGKHE